MPNPSAPLDVERVRTLVADTRFADVRWFAQTGSTNIDAQPLLGRPDAFGTTLVAEYQTAGMGRKGRRWFGQPGAALHFTTILPRAVRVETLWAVPFWAALGVADGVERACGAALDLVWPNDFHARGGKAGGMLSVARVVGDEAFVGCGIGVNVHRPDADPDLAALERPARFLDELVDAPQRESVLAAILRAFDDSLARLDDPDGVATQWERRAQLAGTRYRYRRDADGIERDGIAQRIGERGTLIVRDADGGDSAIDMADVRILERALPADDQPRLH